MGWAIVSLLGFALEIALVIWLARSNTARWERDHRAARAVIRAREEASLRVRAAALMAQGVPPGVRRLPHPHLSHVPHVHLPPRVVDRLAHTREALHRPHLHLPHLHLSHLNLTRRRPDAPAPAPDDARGPSEEQPTS
ncbi:MAG: hypothetical protein M3Q22_17835 [Actinomycetota bacterium]|nr:hypothetical protein [Actinomycetota bacterium]MDP9462032.1 hypothetical protein [Actinomycetota bacterium]